MLSFSRQHSHHITIIWCMLLEKAPGDIIILQVCTIIENHMIYGSCCSMRDRQNFLSFSAISCPFTPLSTQKIKILKKWKIFLEVLSFYTSVSKIMIICYTVSEMVCDGCNFYFSILAIFCPFTPLTIWKIKIKKKKKKKKRLEVSFYTCIPNIMTTWSTVPEIWCTTDR